MDDSFTCFMATSCKFKLLSKHDFHRFQLVMLISSDAKTSDLTILSNGTLSRKCGGGGGSAIPVEFKLLKLLTELNTLVPPSNTLCGLT